MLEGSLLMHDLGMVLMEGIDCANWRSCRDGKLATFKMMIMKVCLCFHFKYRILDLLSLKLFLFNCLIFKESF